MSKPKRPIEHLWFPEDVARSVIGGKEITAQCGAKRTFTRADFIAGLYKACQKCQDIAGERNPDGYGVNIDTSWAGVLERAFTYIDGELSKSSRLASWSWTGSLSTNSTATGGF